MQLSHTMEEGGVADARMKARSDTNFRISLGFRVVGPVGFAIVFHLPSTIFNLGAREVSIPRGGFSASVLKRKLRTEADQIPSWS